MDFHSTGHELYHKTIIGTVELDLWNEDIYTSRSKGRTLGSGTADGCEVM